MTQSLRYWRKSVTKSILNNWLTNLGSRWGNESRERCLHTVPADASGLILRVTDTVVAIRYNLSLGWEAEHSSHWEHISKDTGTKATASGTSSHTVHGLWLQPHKLKSQCWSSLASCKLLGVTAGRHPKNLISYCPLLFFFAVQSDWTYTACCLSVWLTPFIWQQRNSSYI